LHGPVVAAVLARALVGGVLLAAGAAKLRSRSPLFLDAILSFEIVPRWAARPIARLLPWAECALGAALLLGIGTAASAIGAFALITALTAGVANALSRGKRVFCPCFGFTGAQVAHVQWTMTWRNLVLLLACIAASQLDDPLRLDHVFNLSAGGVGGIGAMSSVFALLAGYCIAVRMRWQDERAPTPEQQPLPSTTH
jgi:hypothetical protein